MYVARFSLALDDKYYFFSNADSALQFIRHIVNKEESYYACGKPFSIYLYRVNTIDSLAQCANAVEPQMWNDPDYFFDTNSEPLAEWFIEQ